MFHLLSSFCILVLSFIFCPVSLFFIWSLLSSSCLFSFLFLSCLVSLSLSLSVSLCFSLSLSVSVCLCLGVSLSLSRCGVCCGVMWCVWCCVCCGVVCCGVWCVWCPRVYVQKRLRVYVQNVPVCTGTTPACVTTCGRGAGTHGDVLNLHKEGFFVHTHGREGERRERGEGGHRQFCLPRKAHEEFSLGPTSSPKETVGSYPFEV